MQINGHTDNREYDSNITWDNYLNVYKAYYLSFLPIQKNNTHEWVSDWVKNKQVYIEELLSYNVSNKCMYVYIYIYMYIYIYIYILYLLVI